MAGMSANSRAMAGRWGGTGDGTKAQVRRQARRIEGRGVAADIASDVSGGDYDYGSHWAYDDPSAIEDEYEGFDPADMTAAEDDDPAPDFDPCNEGHDWSGSWCTQCGEYDPLQ